MKAFRASKIRKRHQRIVWGLTIGLFVAVACIPLVVERTLSSMFIAFVVICGGYLLALLILPFIFRRDIPPEQRTRPEIPPEFRRIRPSPVTPEIAELLAGAEMMKEGAFRKRRHVLYRWKKSQPEGEWTGYAEVAEGKVVAWGMEFESVISPLLDLGDSSGEGKFICVSQS